jgi:hypothetical protein
VLYTCNITNKKNSEQNSFYFIINNTVVTGAQTKFLIEKSRPVDDVEDYERKREEEAREVVNTKRYAVPVVECFVLWLTHCTVPWLLHPLKLQI